MNRRNRTLVIAVVVVLLLLIGGYTAAGTMIYNQLTGVGPHCERVRDDVSANTPSAFSASRVDAAPYQMDTFEAVKFTSREDGLDISGWYVPAENPDAPAVILVHGLNGCKRHSSILIPAGMLSHAGFHVLMLDLREHGDSAVVDGRFAAGTDEYRDVLGAWDWLVNEQGIAPEKIGLFGTSLGAASVLNAMSLEPRIAAVWEDSGFSDLQVAVGDFLTYNGFPTFFAPAAPLVGRVLFGDDLTTLSPLAAIAHLNGRPVFIVHGENDLLMPVKHADALAEAVRANGSAVDPWIAEGSGHVGAMFDYPDEYEQKLVQFFTQSLSSGE